MKNLFCYLFVSLMLCLQFGCDKNTPSLSEEIIFNGNEPADFGTGADAISLRVASINDSRCPPQVECVWQGYVQVNFEFSPSGQSLQGFSLCNGGCGAANMPTSYLILYRGKTYKLSVIDVTPYSGSSSGSTQVKISVQAQ